MSGWCKKFSGDFGKVPDVTFYEIHVIGGVARLARWFIESGMRRGTPKEQLENVIMIYGGVDPWKKRVGYKQSDDAYLVSVAKLVFLR